MKIESAVQTRNAIAASLTDIFTKFNAGDVIRARVLDSAMGELWLKLLDGTEFNAKSVFPVDVKKGDLIELLVKNKSDGQLFVETIKNLTADVSTGEVQASGKNNVSKNNISTTDTIKNLLQNNDIPVNDEVVSGINKAVSMFKNLDIAKSVFLIKNNLGLDEININKLNSLMEGKLQLGNDLSELLSVTSDVIDELSGAKESKYGNLLNRNVNDLNLKNIINTDNMQGRDNALAIINSVNDEGFHFDNLFKSLVGEKALNDISDFLKMSDIKEILSQLTGNKITENTSDNFNEIRSKALEVIAGRFILPKAISNKTADIVTEFTLKYNEMLSRQEAETHEIHNEIQKAFFDITEHNDKNDSNISKSYEKILDKIENLKDIIGTSLPHKSDELNLKLDNIKNNISFLQELNKYSSYVQIPIGISNNNSTAELYILKKRKDKKKIDKENASVFVSLNTINLGQVDALINVRYKNLSINLRVEDDKIIKVFKGNYKNLYNSLHDIGYKLVDMRYMTMGEKINPVNIQQVVNKEFESRVNNIDYKI